METRIQLSTSTQYNLSHEEFLRMYTAMALVQYRHSCTPDYCDAKMIRRLRNDFKRFNSEITKVCEQDPNNLVLSQIRNYIQRHLGFINSVTSSAEE